MTKEDSMRYEPIAPCQYCGHAAPHFGVAGEFNCRFGGPRIWNEKLQRYSPDFACKCKQYAPALMNIGIVRCETDRPAS